jgi:hypothetical protein
MDVPFCLPPLLPPSELNGFRFTAREEDAAQVVLGLASGSLDEPGYSAFLHANVARAEEIEAFFSGGEARSSDCVASPRAPAAFSRLSSS